MSGIAYRRDIDGLRAVAVVPVVLAHAGAPGVAGGFVGVDIFFVISGFLITGILQCDLEAGRFSLLRFYERRARRILPALFAVLAVTLVAGYGLLLPEAYEDLAQSSIATLMFVSNIWFLFSTGDYFGVSAEFEPLLHTWSLAVEEQFYIAFPLLLWGLAASGVRLRLGVIWSICLLSFAWSAWAIWSYPLQNFFLIPSRIWELGLGALLALGAVPTTARRAVREAVAWAGLAAIALSILILDGQSPFPGPAALPACAGAAALIWAGAGGGTSAGRLLSMRPMVGIGLISYSLYLWHWPPLVFARVLTGDLHLSAPVATTAVALAFVLAALSWRFVERPFRTPRGDTGGLSRRGVFAASATGAGGLAICAVLVLATQGAAWRLPPDAARSYGETTARSPLEVTCLRDGDCRLGDPDASPSILVWGDSHAAAMLPGLDAYLRDRGQAATAVVQVACPPLIGVRRMGTGPDCPRFNAAAAARLSADPDLTHVILAGRWALAATGRRAPGEPGRDAPLVPSDPNGVTVPPDATQEDVFSAGLRQTLAALRAAGRQVIFVEGLPEMGFHVPRALAQAALTGTDLPALPTIETTRARNAQIDRVLDAALGAEDGETWLHRIDPAGELCRPECPIHAGGLTLYRDDDHLSVAGAEWLIGALFSRADLPF